MSENGRTIEEILDEVLDLPAELRSSRVDELCGDDDALRSEVGSLVRAYERAGDFLESAPATGSDLLGDDPLDRSGTRLGPYELLESIGVGGMGEVYLARREGEGYEQRLAVKLIRGAMFSSEARLRFRNECRVLARLDHPNVARMIEGAIDENGLPYLVMEYVEGLPIDRYVDERALPIDARVALIREVCVAVRHLHQHSIIHRDIKPSNVLVKDDGQVKLIDLGIARLLDAADDVADERTVIGFERMTPAYASPEQLRGDDLSTSTDIYSLGVLLYRVLTGTLPFRGTSRREIEREITSTAVTRPSDVVRGDPERAPSHRRLRGDLDTIVLTALHRDPQRRYSSVEQLGDDLGRYLQGRPVLARGDSWRYRAGKFAQRNAVAVGLSALLLLALIGATVTGFVLFARAERARSEAVDERETAQAVSDFLTSLLAAADPATIDTGSPLTVREVLDRATERIDHDLVDRPRLANELRLTVGHAYHNLGAFGTALAQYEATRRSTAGEDRELAARIDTQEAHTRVALEQWAAAESLLTLALSDSSRVSTSTRATAHLVRAQLYEQTARYDLAMDEARVARRLSASERRGSLNPARATSMMGEIAYRLGDLQEAERSMREALALARRDLGVRHTLTATCMQNLGVVLSSTGEVSEAIGVLEEALVALTEIYGPEHVETANTMTSLADALQTAGRHAEALAHYVRVREILEQTVGRDSYRYGTVVANEANVRRQLGDLEGAATGFREAIANYRGALGERHPWSAIVQTNLARVRFEQGFVDEAESLATQAESVLAESFPDGNPAVARVLGVLAEIDLQRGRVPIARERVARAAAITGTLPLLNRDRVNTVILEARCREAADERGAARELLEEYLESATPLADPQSEELLRLRDAFEALAGS